jgi:hypothetical protein
VAHHCQSSIYNCSTSVLSQKVRLKSRRSKTCVAAFPLESMAAEVSSHRTIPLTC